MSRKHLVFGLFGCVFALSSAIALLYRWHVNTMVEYKRESRVRSWRVFREEVAEVYGGHRKLIELYHSEDSDAKVDELSQVNGLEILSVQGGDFSDSGMKSVALIPGLKDFTYSGGGVSADGIRCLENHTTIRRLDLQTVSLPPTTATVFASMKNLRSLTLFMLSTPSEVPVRNEEFSRRWSTRLAELTQLERLRVGYMYVGSEQLEELRRALPNTVIEVLYVAPI